MTHFGDLSLEVLSFQDLNFEVLNFEALDEHSRVMVVVEAFAQQTGVDHDRRLGWRDLLVVRLVSVEVGGCGEESIRLGSNSS